MERKRKKKQGVIRWLLSAVLVISLMFSATSGITIAYAESESSKAVDNTQITDTVDETESSTETGEIPPVENEISADIETEEPLPGGSELPAEEDTVFSEAEDEIVTMDVGDIFNTTGQFTFANPDIYVPTLNNANLTSAMIYACQDPNIMVSTLNFDKAGYSAASLSVSGKRITGFTGNNNKSNIYCVYIVIVAKDSNGIEYSTGFAPKWSFANGGYWTFRGGDQRVSDDAKVITLIEPSQGFYSNTIIADDLEIGGFPSFTPYTGSAITPTDASDFSIYLKSSSVFNSSGSPFILRKGTDYTVTYANNINPGTATAYIKLNNPYTGTVAKTWTIGTPICKIGTKGYNSMQGAVDAIKNGTATDTSGATGAGKTNYKIEMLVDEYEITQEYSIPENKNVTVTTASVKDSDIPYRGTNEVTILKRNESLNASIFNVPEGASLSIEKVTLDGGWGGPGTEPASVNYAMITVGGNCTLKNQAILQNGYNTFIDIGGAESTCYTAGAIAGVTSNSVIAVKDGSRITNCASASAGGAIVSKGGTVSMSGGLIDSCYVTATNDRTNNGAAVHMYEPTAEFTMTGGLISKNNNMSAKADINGGAVQINGGKATITGGYIIGNRTTGHGGGIAQGNSDAEINVGGSVYISENYGDCMFSKEDYKVISEGNNNNVYIINSMNVVSPLAYGKKVGITVSESNHIPGYDFAQAVGNDETDSEAIASASYGNFLDDYDPGLKIGVDPDDLTKIHFMQQTTQQLSISKTVAGSHGDKSQSFDINITLKKDETGSPLKAGTQFSYVGAGGAADGVLTLDENGVGTITLKDGQAITVEGLDKGVYYIIEEVTVGGAKNSAYGYAVSYDGEDTTSSTGVLTENTTVAITNTRTIVPTAVETGTKGLIALLAGCSLAGAAFFTYCRRKKNV